jgi:hypothetical protein
MMRNPIKRCTCANLPYCFGAQTLPAPQDPKLQHWIIIDVDQQQHTTIYQCPTCKRRWQEQQHQGLINIYTFYCLSDSTLSIPSRRQWVFYTSLLIGLLLSAILTMITV